MGNIYLFSLNRERSDADVEIPASSGITVLCFGKVLLPKRPRCPPSERTGNVKKPLKRQMILFLGPVLCYTIKYGFMRRQGPCAPFPADIC